MTEDRSIIDPEDKYPAEGLRFVERRALEVLKLLPGALLTRTRDVIQINHAGPLGVVIVLTAEHIELRLPTTEWTGGAYGPAPSSEFWRRRKWSTVEAGEGKLQSLIDQALARRKAEFIECKFCKNEFPPEHRHSPNVCHGCAERHLGVVH